MTEFIIWTVQTILWVGAGLAVYGSILFLLTLLCIHFNLVP